MVVRVEINDIVFEETNETFGINGVKFIFDSPDDTKEKNFGATVGLVLSGEINEKNKNNTLELGKWALCEKGEDIYRKVKVQVIDNEDNILREYKFSAMFVVDYREELKEVDHKFVSNFEIVLRQKEKETDIEIQA